MGMGVYDYSCYRSEYRRTEEFCSKAATCNFEFTRVQGIHVARAASCKLLPLLLVPFAFVYPSVAIIYTCCTDRIGCPSPYQFMVLYRVGRDE
jgi:hypothetical protein